MAGKASLPKTIVDESVKNDKERKKQFGRERANFSKVSLTDTSNMGYNYATSGAPSTPLGNQIDNKANTTLNNLALDGNNVSQVAINTDLLFGSAGHDIGGRNTLHPVDRLYTQTLRFGGSSNSIPPNDYVGIGTTSGQSGSGTGETGDMILNVPTNNGFRLAHGNTEFLRIDKDDLLFSGTGNNFVKIYSNGNSLQFTNSANSGSDLILLNAATYTKISQSGAGARQFIFEGDSGNGANVGTQIVLEGKSGANNSYIKFNTDQSTADTEISSIRFHGEDSSGNDTHYATISGKCMVPTGGVEAGKLAFEVADNGTERTTYMTMDGFWDEIKMYKKLDMGTNNIENVGTLTIEGNLVIDSGSQIKSYDTENIGIHVTNNSDKGTKGALEGPYDQSTSLPSQSSLDDLFGEDEGSIGVYEDTDATTNYKVHFYYRGGDGWYKIQGTKV
jgi:hypothetical protein